MSRLLRYIVLLVVLLPVFSWGQGDYSIDSLKKVVWQSSDTTRLSAINQLVGEYVYVNSDTAWLYADTLLKEAQEAGSLLFESAALNYQGYVKRDLDFFTESIAFFEEALAIRKELNLPNKVSITENLLGTVYHRMGDWEKALEFYVTALHTAEIKNNIRYLSGPTNNIGKLYSDMGEFEKAKEYDLKALEISKRMNDPYEMAVSYNNLGTIFQEEGYLDTAKLFFKEAFRLYEETGNLDGAANVFNNMAIIYFMEGDYKESLKYFKDAMRMRLEDKDMVNYSQSLLNLSIYYQLREDYDSAVYFANECATVAKQYGALMEQKDAYEVLAYCNDSLGRYEEAFRAFQQHILIKDSVMDEKSMKNMQELEAKYKVSEQKKELELKDLKLKKEEEERTYEASRKKFQFTLIGIGGVGMLLVLLLIGRGYVLKRKSNIKLEEINGQLESQKTIIEEKNKDITDSILYAQRIQEAMLYSKSDVKGTFEDSFILYKPKDIVAGDFYWWLKEEDRCYLAAADCTGHGVPGAMVSVVCANVLNKSVKELGLKKPSDILDKATDLVIDVFDNEGKENIKDGMDIALCSFQKKLNSYHLQYAGANNPLWIIRKDGTFEDITANRQPIGYYQYREPFINHQVELNQGDSIYMFSDGFVDQFGGPKNKKYKSNNFKKKLLEIYKESMQTQMQVLEQELEKWKGDFEQTDDICVIGVRI